MTDPERIGSYLILGRLGAGGMGIAYLAEQTAPVRRQVAIKLIRGGQLDRSAVARFERERQILASLDHPHVARLFDAGHTAEGGPYLVMEHIPGRSITAYCEGHGIPLRGRLRLFLDLCDAIEHAHQQGVLHRDIKPSNILVDERQREGLLKVIDFGVAKVLADSAALTGAGDATRAGGAIGTPQYMSPEQAMAGAVPIDTRSDVYSLGAVLYELLTGVPPFDARELQRAAFQEVQRRLQEETPVRPSTLRRRRGGAAAPGRRMGREGGDLDWITAKAMAKDPDARYASVSELAADLRRHLRHEPIQARPPSRIDAVVKFVRRNRGSVAATAAILLILTLGLASAESRRRIAVAQEAVARLEAGRAEEQAREAEEQQRRAEDRTRRLLRLAAALDLQTLQQDAETLWPVRLESVARLDEWLQRAAWLAAELPEMQQDLRDLRARAEVSVSAVEPDEEWQADRRWAVAMLQTTRRHLQERKAGHEQPFRVAVYPESELARRVEACERLLADVDARVEPVRTLHWARVEDRWWHDQLARVVEGIELLVRPDPAMMALPGQQSARGVERRRERAETVHWESVSSPEAEEAWSRAAEAVESSPRYRGLRLKPQEGLLPLGEDPDSGLFEFVHVLTGEAPERGASGRLELTAESGIVFVLLPGGTFRMGAQRTDPDAPCYDRTAPDLSCPVHRVTLEPFFLAKYELSVAVWERFTGEQSRTRTGRSAMEPMSHTTWYAANESLLRMGLALPTEAQWEYAARAGTETPYVWGTDPRLAAQQANLLDQSSPSRYTDWDPVPWNDGYPDIAPVGSLRPNPFGLFNLYGNLSEWCRDPALEYFYPVRSGDGLRGKGSSTHRIYRGGSKDHPVWAARVFHRASSPLENVAEWCGIRPAREVDS